MDFTNRISRSEIAEQLRVPSQTIAKWERMGTFPQAKEHVSDRVILYDRDEVHAAIENRIASRPRHVPLSRT